MLHVFHIVSGRAWPPAEGTYRGETLVTEGFTHCSTARQLIPIANGLFRGRPGLRVLVIDVSRVRSKIIYENLENGRDSCPHVHGPLDAEAVTDTFALTASPDGAFTAPAYLARC